MKHRPLLSPEHEAAKEKLSSMPGICSAVEAKPGAGTSTLITAQMPDGTLVFEILNGGYSITVTRTDADQIKDHSGILITAKYMPTWSLMVGQIEVGAIWRLLAGKLRRATSTETRGLLTGRSCFVYKGADKLLAALSSDTLQEIEHLLAAQRAEHGYAVLQFNGSACLFWNNWMSDEAILRTIGTSIECFIKLRLWTVSAP